MGEPRSPTATEAPTPNSPRRSERELHPARVLCQGFRSAGGRPTGRDPACRLGGGFGLLDLKAIREDPQAYRLAMARRGAQLELDRVLALDEERRALTVQVEELRADQNRGSKEVGGAPSPRDRQVLISRLRVVADRLKELEPELTRV